MDPSKPQPKTTLFHLCHRFLDSDHKLLSRHRSKKKIKSKLFINYFWYRPGFILKCIIVKTFDWQKSADLTKKTCSFEIFSPSFCRLSSQLYVDSISCEVYYDLGTFPTFAYMYIVENNVNLIFELRKNRWVSLWNFLTWHISASLLLKANLLISPYFLCWYETTDMFLNICFTIEVFL